MTQTVRPVIVVSGLPRSGTSLMMQMLAAGGVPIMTDGLREPDPNNPKGYYEFERAKKLAEDASWMGEAAGKAVKIVSPLLEHLPPDFQYEVIFMQRDMQEILASQQAMLGRLGTRDTADVDDQVMAARFQEHLDRIEQWLAAQSHVRVHHVAHSAVISAPTAVAADVARFLGRDMDPQAMAAVLDRSLYRQRTE